MPKLQFKIEGKGNGIKTNVMNMYDIAKALRVNTDCNETNALFKRFALIIPDTFSEPIP